MAGRGAVGCEHPRRAGVLIGASDDLAWGATVSNADQSDWVIVEVDPRIRAATAAGEDEPFADARVSPICGRARPRARSALRVGARSSRTTGSAGRSPSRDLARARGLDLDIIELPVATEADGARRARALGRAVV